MNRILFAIAVCFLTLNAAVFCIAFIDVKTILQIDPLFTYEFVFFPLFFYSLFLLTKGKITDNDFDFTLIKRIGGILLIITAVFFVVNMANESVCFDGDKYFMIENRAKVEISAASFFTKYRLQILCKTSLNMWFSYISSIVLFLKQRNER